MVDPVEYIWALFEETPRPSHLPPCLFPNEYPFELGFKYYPQPVVPVTSGPLSSYHDHDHDHDPLSSYHDHDRIPVPGEPGAPPVWCSDFPPDQPDVPLPSAGAPLPSSTAAPLLPIDVPGPASSHSSLASTDCPSLSPPVMSCILPSKTYPGKLPHLHLSKSDKILASPPQTSPFLPEPKRRKNERRCGRL